LRRVRVIFSGHVQGVGFRATTRTFAHALALTGWVRNEPDGTVCAEIQGASPDIDRLLELIAKRMEGMLRSTDLGEIPVITSEDDFVVRR
jgi:acylphosphatase